MILGAKWPHSRALLGKLKHILIFENHGSLFSKKLIFMEVLSASREVDYFKILNQNHGKSQYITYHKTVTENTLTDLACHQVSEESAQ